MIANISLDTMNYIFEFFGIGVVIGPVIMLVTVYLHRTRRLSRRAMYPLLALGLLLLIIGVALIASINWSNHHPGVVTDPRYQ